MREIKFRIWDTVEQRMICDEQDILDFSKKWSNKSIDLYNSPYNKDELYCSPLHYLFAFTSSIKRFPELKFLQYTGMKDKNKVEIFEGDILKHSYGITIIKSDMQYNCGCCDSIWGWSLDHYYEAGEMEVIGNIYQHPERAKIVVDEK